LCGDILGLLSANALNIEELAVPVSCNTAIESSGLFTHIERTKIGSPYVIAEFAHLAKKFNSIAGFEANGGFLLGSDVTLNGLPLKSLPTRVAVLLAIMLLVAADEGLISTLVNALPQRFTHSDRIQNFATIKRQAIIAQGKNDSARLLARLGFDDLMITNVDKTDGLRVALSDERIIHLRPSGNTPELRYYTEVETCSIANQDVVRTLKNA
jgi:phosphomannomutase